MWRYIQKLTKQKTTGEDEPLNTFQHDVSFLNISLLNNRNSVTAILLFSCNRYRRSAYSTAKFLTCISLHHNISRHSDIHLNKRNCGVNLVGFAVVTTMTFAGIVSDNICDCNLKTLHLSIILLIYPHWMWQWTILQLISPLLHSC